MSQGGGIVGSVRHFQGDVQVCVGVQRYPVVIRLPVTGVVSLQIITNVLSLLSNIFRSTMQKNNRQCLKQISPTFFICALLSWNSQDDFVIQDSLSFWTSILMRPNEIPLLDILMADWQNYTGQSTHTTRFANYVSDIPLPALRPHCRRRGRCRPVYPPGQTGPRRLRGSRSVSPGERTLHLHFIQTSTNIASYGSWSKGWEQKERVVAGSRYILGFRGGGCSRKYLGPSVGDTTGIIMVQKSEQHLAAPRTSRKEENILVDYTRIPLPA